MTSFVTDAPRKLAQQTVGGGEQRFAGPGCSETARVRLAGTEERFASLSRGQLERALPEENGARITDARPDPCAGPGHAHDGGGLATGRCNEVRIGLLEQQHEALFVSCHQFRGPGGYERDERIRRRRSLARDSSDSRERLALRPPASGDRTWLSPIG